MKFLMMVLGLFVMSYDAQANFTIVQNGKTYECTEVSGGCWSSCPYTFSTCASSCGGGQECWDACPYSFGTCVNTCGGGDGCWDECPYSFGSCASDCGGGQKCWDACPYSFGTCSSSCGGTSISPKAFEKFMDSNESRLEKEKADRIMTPHE